MKKLYLKKNIDFKRDELWKRGAYETDGTLIIEEPTLVYDADTGEYLFGLFNLKSEPKELLRALNSIDFATTKRTNGMITTSKIFGYMPKIKIRKNACSKANMYFENPNAHEVICNYVDEIEGFYQEYAKETYVNHREKTNKVLGEWTIKNSVFTSGIVNKNNPLKYHYDAGNFEDVYSCMVTLKKNIGGGYLMIPEYNAQVRTFDNSLLMFDGQKILHGVSPITKGIDSYRYTIVFYSLKGMRQCKTFQDELKGIRAEKQALYKRRNKELKS